MYSSDDVARTLAMIGNGGIPYRREDTPDPDMPRAASNPAQGGTWMCEQIDVRRAFKAAVRDELLRDPVAVLEHCVHGMSVGEIAGGKGSGWQAVDVALAADLNTVAVLASKGAR